MDTICFEDRIERKKKKPQHKAGFFLRYVLTSLNAGGSYRT